MKTRHDLAIYLLAIGQTFAWASIYYVFPALLLRWEQDLGWSKVDLTAAITMAILVSALVSPVAGRIIDRGHGPILVGVAALIGGLGLVLLSFVNQQWQFYAVWVLMGIAIAGCLYEPCFALVTRSRGVNAKQAIILITLAAGFASTISYPLAHILAEALGWRGATRVFAAIVIFVVAPTLWLGVQKLEEGQSTQQNKASENRSTKAFMRKPAFWFLAIGFACLAIAHSATVHHLLPILDERHLSAEMAILVASFLGPMQVVGRLAMMASQRYFSNFSVAVAAFGLMGLSIAMLLFSASSLTIISGFVILFGGAFGTVSILRPLIAREILGQGNFGAKSGALAMFFLTGLALAPFLGSLLWNLGGYDLMLLALMCFLLLGFILFWQANRLARAK